MISWPALGTRVAVRYRLPAGSVPPLTDVIGHLLQTTPTVRVHTKTGDHVDVAPADVVALRALSDQPVRASQIRALEHADALSWHSVERHWLDGWLLRAGSGHAYQSNSALPLDTSATLVTLPAIVEWYSERRLTPLLAVPDRLLRLPVSGEHSNRVLVRDVGEVNPDPSVQLSAEPDGSYPMPVDELTGCDGELTFGTLGDGAVRATVTESPDRTRWVGLSPFGTASAQLGETMLAWGASLGATRGYIRVGDGDPPAEDLARSLGFVLHHHARYITATALT